MDQPPPPPAQPPLVEPPKKGLHPLAWVGIGCGGLLVVVIIAGAILVGMAKRKYEEIRDDFATAPEKTAAEMIVRMNPDLEMVRNDEGSGEMTVLVRDTGEEVTVS